MSEWDFALNLYHNKIIHSYLSTHINTTGAEVLAESLKNNHTIKLLDLKWNEITVSGAIAILDAAVNNGVCQEVIIDSKYKSDDKVKELMTILKERKKQEVGSIIT